MIETLITVFCFVVGFYYLRFIYRVSTEVWPQYLPAITERIRIARALKQLKKKKPLVSETPAYIYKDMNIVDKKDLIRMHIQEILTKEGPQVALKYMRNEVIRLRDESDYEGADQYRWILNVSKKK